VGVHAIITRAVLTDIIIANVMSMGSSFSNY